MSPQNPIERRSFLAQVAGATLAMTATTQQAGTAADLASTSVPELPPADLDALEDGIQAVLDRQRIGRPAFVRYTLLGSLKQEELLPILSRMLDVVTRWLGQPIARVHAIGSIAAGQVSLTVQTAEGTTALVSIGQARTVGDGVDLMVVGDRGAICHDAGQGLVGCGSARYRQPAGEPKLLRLIEKALGSGRPETP